MLVDEGLHYQSFGYRVIDNIIKKDIDFYEENPGRRPNRTSFHCIKNVKRIQIIIIAK